MLKVVISMDEETESPREWDNVGTMVCWHNRYNLGDKQPKEHVWNWLYDMVTSKFELDSETEYTMDDLTQLFFDHVGIIKPLYLYDHSGITISTSPFSCPWDSGQIGYIYVTYDKLGREYGEGWNKQDVEKNLDSEVNVYDHYLTGSVFQYDIYDVMECEHCGNVIEKYLEGCGGYYGHYSHKDMYVEILKIIRIYEGNREWTMEDIKDIIVESY